MRRLTVASVLFALAFVPARGAMASAEVRPVLVVRFVGLPRDSVSRRDMLAGFHDEMRSARLRTERLTGGEWQAGDSLANSFELVDATANSEAWTLELSVRVPPPVRAPVLAQRGTRPEDSQPVRPRFSNIASSRGMIVAATAAPPSRKDRTRLVEPSPTVVSLYFPAARRIVVPSPNLPGGGYAYPWDEAGRAVARTALEALLRANGMIESGQRADLAPAARLEPADE